MKTKHNCFTRNAAFGSFATLLIAAAALPVPAFADLCRNPEITITNLKDVPMNVTKIIYFDGCDNRDRTEDVQNRIIMPGWSTTYTDNLDYVGNCEVNHFHLDRQTLDGWTPEQGGGTWSRVITGGQLHPNEGDNVVCNTGTEYTLENH